MAEHSGLIEVTGSSGPVLGPGRVERLIGREKVIVLAGAFLVALIAGIYTVLGVGMSMTAIDMTRMAQPIGTPMQMGGAPVWTPVHAGLMFLMWWIMMIAMMTPSAAPALLLYSAIKRVGPEAGKARVLSGFFLAGYLIAWAMFSLAAVIWQWGLESIGLVDGPMMTIKSRSFAGLVLLLAGLYQFSQQKQWCLSLCQSPVQFLARSNLPGRWGALRMGVGHGTYCVGCCWALMALLFVGGIMNLYWIMGLAVYVALEKLWPHSRWLVYGTGGGLILSGGYLVIDSFLT